MSDHQTNLTLRQRHRLNKSDAAAAAGMDPETERRILRISLLTLLILLAAGGAWASFGHRAGDARLQEVIALQTKVSKLDSPFGKDGMELHREIWTKMKDLPDDLKREAGHNAEKLFQARFDHFFAEPSQDQLKELDNYIAGMQAMEQLRNLQNSLAGNQSANSNSNSANNNGQGPRGRNDQQRTQMIERMITSHSPQQRGEFNLGRQMMNARMQQQGIQEGGGFF